MIDPATITNYGLSDPELEEHILFWVCAAGKNGTTAARCLEKLLSAITFNQQSPFQIIRLVLSTKEPEPLPDLMKWAGIGCYNHKARTFEELVHSKLNLRTCTPDDLEKIYGIGMKTSRCFILHSRRNAQVAGLDTHMLKYLTNLGISRVPKSTPGSKKLYKYLENEVLKLAREKGMTPAEFDLFVWNQYKIKSEPQGLDK